MSSAVFADKITLKAGDFQTDKDLWEEAQKVGDDVAEKAKEKKPKVEVDLTQKEVLGACLRVLFNFEKIR